MPELAQDLSILIAETNQVTADLDYPVADTQTSNVDADMAVAETASVEAGLQMRIRTEESQLLGLNLRVTDTWSRVEELANRYLDPIISLAHQNDSIMGIFCGEIEILVVHVDGDSIVRCTTNDRCTACGEEKPVRLFTASNFYDMADQRLKILVCDEALTFALQNASPTLFPFTDKVMKLRNTGRQDFTLRDVYAVEFVGGEEAVDSNLLESLAAMELYNLATYEVAKLIGPVL